MVAVIDDRGDVWGWQANLVKVMPYDFFVGIGDINSSFLPRQVPLTLFGLSQFTSPPTSPPRTPPPKVPEHAPSRDPPAETSTEPASDTPTIDSLLELTQADDPALIAAQTEEQNEMLEQQQVERPLAAAQHALDVKNEELASASSESEEEDEELYGDKSSKGTPSPAPQKQSLLRNDDSELQRLAGVLKNVWDAFYDTYRKNVEDAQREKQLLRLEGRPKNLTETGKVPDIRDIMTRMRRSVLDGVVIVFSGVIPLTVNWETYVPHEMPLM
jgi:RNA polymerase II subunit A C-terminal domain phosphatase